METAVHGFPSSAGICWLSRVLHSLGAEVRILYSDARKGFFYVFREIGFGQDGTVAIFGGQGSLSVAGRENERNVAAFEYLSNGVDSLARHIDVEDRAIKRLLLREQSRFREASGSHHRA